MINLKEYFTIVCVSLSLGFLPLSMALVYGCQASPGHEENIKSEPKPVKLNYFEYIQDPKTGLCFAYGHNKLANVSCTVCSKVGSCLMIERVE